MKDFFYSITKVFPACNDYNFSILVFRILVSVELMMAHGVKKLGIGAAITEQIPNPLHLPGALNEAIATSVNLFFPVFIVFGFFTRLAALPILVVTLTSYFILHWGDSVLEKDAPFMYSAVFLLILVLGPGKYSIDYFINRRIYL